MRYRFVVEVGRVAQAICYTKGCYLGQEPIVMARDRGQVQRTLLGLKVSGDGPVPRGSKLVRDGKDVGVTASSVVSPALGQPIALAYLRRGSQEPGTVVEVRIEDDDETTLYLVGSIEERHETYDVLSTGSPLGQALLGHGPGEVVTYEGPRRAFQVEVVSVRPGL